MERILQRKFWIFFSIAVGIFTILIGKKWLFIESSCPRLQDILLYISTVLVVIICIVYIFVTHNDSVITQVISMVVELILILAVSSISGSYLGNQPSVQSIYCNVNVCEKADFAQSMRKSGNLDAAEQVSRTCIVDISNKIIPETCLSECSRELSYALYEKAGNIIDNLQSNLTLDEDGRCETAKDNLEEAKEVISTFDYIDLTNSIQERENRLLEKCVIVKEPTPTIQYEVLRTSWNADKVYFDVRVLENNGFLSNLTADDFLVTLNGVTIPATVEEKSSDDKLCLVTVIDNSGSIYDGLDGIRTAIQKVSDSRKPGDELGMVVFSGNDKINVVQAPSEQNIDPAQIDGQGQMTALWDGILVGLDTASSCQSTNRYLLVLTDGKDNDSLHLEGDDDSKARTIAARAVTEGVNICTIGITDKVDQDSLELVSSGCGYQYAENFDSVADKLQGIFGYVYGFYRVNLNPVDVPNESQLYLRIKNTQGVPVEFK